MVISCEVIGKVLRGGCEVMIECVKERIEVEDVWEVDVLGFGDVFYYGVTGRRSLSLRVMVIRYR